MIQKSPSTNAIPVVRSAEFMRRSEQAIYRRMDPKFHELHDRSISGNGERTSGNAATSIGRLVSAAGCKIFAAEAAIATIGDECAPEQASLRGLP